MIRGRLLFGNAFSPLSLPGLAGWYDAGQVLWQDAARRTRATSAGDPVGAWDDLTNRCPWVQPVRAARPTLHTRNGRPVVRMDGVDDCLVAAFDPDRPCVLSPLNLHWRVTGGVAHLWPVWGPQGEALHGLLPWFGTPDFAEVVVCAAPLQESLRQQLENYFRAKWGTS